jgi:hypothetical protein
MSRTYKYQPENKAKRKPRSHSLDRHLSCRKDKAKEKQQLQHYLKNILYFDKT